jgi:hypothetical protein
MRNSWGVGYFKSFRQVNENDVPVFPHAIENNLLPVGREQSAPENPHPYSRPRGSSGKVNLIDIPRLREGGLHAIFFSISVS